jgi:hypothetical protein
MPSISFLEQYFWEHTEPEVQLLQEKYGNKDDGDLYLLGWRRI